MRTPAVVALGVVMASAVLLSVQRFGGSSDSATPESTIQEVRPAESEQNDSVRAIRAVVRRRISDSDTYLGYALAADDSVLRRWQDRTVRELTIFVGDNAAVTSREGLEPAVRRAFDRWERVGAIPVSFQVIRDSTRAEVQVFWINSFPMDRSGQAEVFWGTDGWIRKATLTLATHDIRGRAVGPDFIYTVALHEIGHLLGLGHSDDPDDLMYPVTTMGDLTARDRRSARLLYALPPGSVKDPEGER